MFSAGETALFLEGKQIGKLNKEETFAYALLKNNLRLAAYSLPYEGQTYTLTIRRSSPEIKLCFEERPLLNVKVEMTAGVSSTANARPLLSTADAGDFPKELLRKAAIGLEDTIRTLFEKCRAIGFDVCDAIDKLQKYENKRFSSHKDTLLQECDLSVRVNVHSIR